MNLESAILEGNGVQPLKIGGRKYEEIFWFPFTEKAGDRSMSVRRHHRN
jgi:hypothetical protein